MLWYALSFVTGIALGLAHPMPALMLVLVLTLTLSVCLMVRSRAWSDVLILLAWLLMGCCRASFCSYTQGEPAHLTGIKEKAQAIQTTLVERLQRADLSPRTLALCAALSVGQKQGLDAETRQAYARIGASHLLALSGMHLGILYALLYWVLLRPLRFGRWRWLALPPFLLCVWGYTLVAGLPASLVRAAIMLSFFTIMLLYQYSTDNLHALALSAIVVLLASPQELMSLSFQLSYTAVFFLLAVWAYLSDRCCRWSKVVRLLMVSVIAQAGTMPLTAYYFHQLPWLAPLFSLILIPLTSLILYGSLLAMALPFPLLGHLLNGLADLQHWIVDKGSRIHGIVMEDLYPSIWYVVLAYGILLLLVVLMRTSRHLEPNRWRNRQAPDDRP